MHPRAGSRIGLTRAAELQRDGCRRRDGDDRAVASWAGIFRTDNVDAPATAAAYGGYGHHDDLNLSEVRFEALDLEVEAQRLRAVGEGGIGDQDAGVDPPGVISEGGGNRPGESRLVHQDAAAGSNSNHAALRAAATAAGNETVTAGDSSTPGETSQGWMPTMAIRPSNPIRRAAARRSATAS